MFPAMSFHFQPHPDSSDDDAPIDLTKWKTGTTSDVPRRSSAIPTHGFRAINSASFDREVIGTKSLTPQDATTAFRTILEPDVQIQLLPEEKEESALAEEEEGGGDEPVNEVFRQHREEKVLQCVAIPPFEGRTSDFEELDGEDIVRNVLWESTGDDDSIIYMVEFEDRHVQEVLFEQLLLLRNGQEALAIFDESPTQAPGKDPSTRSASIMGRPSFDSEFVDPIMAIDSLEPSEDESVANSHPKRGKRKRQTQVNSQYMLDDEQADEDEGESSGYSNRKLRSRSNTIGRQLRSRAKSTAHPDEDDEDLLEENLNVPFLQSDVGARKRRRTLRNRGGSIAPDHFEDEIGFEKIGRQRASARATRHTGAMREVEINDIYRHESESSRAKALEAKTKIVGVREIFKPLPRNDEFRVRHCQQCDVCSNNASFAALVYCQGCTLAYHKQCLGHRAGREHLVTKVGDDDFVLQCRRCMATSRKKDKTAPDHGKCQDCRERGLSCSPFRSRKTTAQEQRERDENNGVDPIINVDPKKINNADNVLFRCRDCSRGFHFEHLPPKDETIIGVGEGDAEQRFREYCRDWTCKECYSKPAKVSGIVAWKPIDEDKYDPALPVDEIDEDDKAYLVKWEGHSYFRAAWMPGAWVWGTTAHGTRKAFAKKDESQHPKMRTEDAIPEDYLRADIVLDIKYTSIVDIKTEEIDKARIREVDKALIKYKGLSYEEAVWEQPPTPDDGDRWTDFVIAYNDCVAGRYIKQPSRSTLKARMDKVRSKSFADLEKKSQPNNVVGGELMKYQIEGLNWLYYKWYAQKNAILADEMGLGKTIQIIGFLATLVNDWSCFPFLIVVPNSTCPNWRREIKRWAPTLRVVTYYGSKEARDLAHRHELYPEHSKELKCHVVVTSYDAAADESCRKFFRNVAWQGLVVDEGQRLKNERTQLYSALGALKAPFKVLLTGTPLQNNQRELFNLLQFLDDSYNAETLTQQYEDLTADKIGELHNMIRPFFLRRTKAQVLTFLPPMAQIIVPVSMSIVQKKLYRTILAKNPELIKAIFSPEAGGLKPTERGSLSNMLMQLRKCLCHPFVYNRGIEEKQVEWSASHRNLVDASSKLQLLEILLPKLKERGHRVLIFSQFLDMLDMVEDFLDGLALTYQRLDGSISALNKQKRIDEFNAPGSSLFAFLLSTRAGGVGINLATADTVIILDPDFNPHQDIQALSRAHRIGQQKKVLCFQLVTRASAEEKVMQIGRKKLALDHVLIRGMDDEDTSEQDLTNILRHGASELFNDDASGLDIVYDGHSVDRLLDRSHIESTQAGDDKSAETQFSFARVWANDAGALKDKLASEGEDDGAGGDFVPPDPGVWAKILQERERVAAEEAAAKAEAFGRGRRAKAKDVDYASGVIEDLEGISGTTGHGRRRKDTGIGGEGESDTDFQADYSDPESEDGKNDDIDIDREDQMILNEGTKHDGAGSSKKPSKASNHPPFKRSIVQPPQSPKAVANPNGLSFANINGADQLPLPFPVINCRACRLFHAVGSCPLKLGGVEYCNLCGIAHYGYGRVCPHIQSETQVRAMLEALKHSNESEHHIAEARKYLRGLKGNLVQEKKTRELKARAAREMAMRPDVAGEYLQQHQQMHIGGYQRY